LAGAWTAVQVGAILRRVGTQCQRGREDQ
jgi:hypothetical protein